MDTRKCKSCGQELRPAGFWIRVGAYIIDSLIFIPIIILSVWNTWSLKSTTVLVLSSLPGFIYKPFMESFFGATLGKMSCKLKVIDDNGNKLSLFSAYIRFFPFLFSAGVTLAGQLIVFSSPQFQSATSMMELAEAQQGNYLDVVSYPASALVLIDCVLVAFTFRKRALHDMMAESFCVYKEP